MSKQSQIAQLAVYSVDLPVADGAYHWSDGRSASTFDSTVVRLETDGGLVGWGETCPLGSSYVPAYADGIRAGIAHMATAIIGSDVRSPATLAARMDTVLKGHKYAKAAVDIACWDLVGQTTGLSVGTLFGGAFGEDIALYRAISQDSPAAMAEEVARWRRHGYRRFQLKVGGDVSTDVERIRAVAEVLCGGDILVADANGGWHTHEAIRVARALTDIDLYIEQPCRSYEECLAVRRAIVQPMILDESIDSVAAIIRAHADGAMDVASLKLSKHGGLSGMRVARDVCAALGVPMTIEDAWGSDLTTAAIAAAAQSTPERLRFNSIDFRGYVAARTANGGPDAVDGRLPIIQGAGLGVTVVEEILGSPVLEVSLA